MSFLFGFRQPPQFLDRSIRRAAAVACHVIVIPRQHDMIAFLQFHDHLADFRIPDRVTVKIADLYEMARLLGGAIFARFFVFDVLLDRKGGELAGTTTILGATPRPSPAGAKWTAFVTREHNVLSQEFAFFPVPGSRRCRGLGIRGLGSCNYLLLARRLGTGLG